MSTSRDAILGCVREALREQDERPAHPGPAPQPALRAPALEQFIAKAEAAAATVQRLAIAAELPLAIDTYRQHHRLPPRLMAAPHPLLQGLSWPQGLQVAFGTAGAEDRLGVTVPEYAIAETGSLVLLAGRRTPTALNLLPEHLICALPLSRLLASPEAFWTQLRRAGGLPRAVNFITGPSRTADVEQKMQLGAHGPRSLLILLIEGGEVLPATE